MGEKTSNPGIRRFLQGQKSISYREFLSDRNQTSIVRNERNLKSAVLELGKVRIMSDCVKACGIDLGTSEIAVAVVDSSNPLGTKLVSNKLSNETTPGVLKIYREVRSIGEDAAATATMCPQNVYSHLPLVLRCIDSLEDLQGRYPDLCFKMRSDEQKGVVFDVCDDSLISEMSIMHALSMLFNYVFQIIEKSYPEYVNRAVVAVPSGLSSACVRLVTDAAHLAGFKEVLVTNTDKAQTFKWLS